MPNKTGFSIGKLVNKIGWKGLGGIVVFWKNGEDEILDGRKWLAERLWEDVDVLEKF